MFPLRYETHAQSAPLAPAVPPAGDGELPHGNLPSGILLERTKLHHYFGVTGLPAAEGLVIDTAAVALEGKMKQITPEWKKKGAYVICDDKGRTLEGGTSCWVHVQTGVKIFTQGDIPTRAEGSLPRLLFGHNGKLIKTQEELDRAIGLFIEKVQEVCEIAPHAPLWLKRLDLVLHLPLNPEKLTRIYRDFLPPKLRKPAIPYPRGLFWKGGLRRCRLYDKRHQLRKKRGEISRLEWELRRDTIRTAFGSRQSLRSLKIKECYAAYRNLALGFVPKKLLKKGSLPTLVGFLQRSAYRSPDGVSIAQFMENTRTRASYRRLMRDALAESLDTEKIDFAEYLPPTLEEIDWRDVE